MASDQPLGFRDTLGVLRPGPFRRYIIGEAVSMTGTWMQMMAQGWVLATLTTSAFMLGLVSVAASLPMLLLAMPAGVVADRHDKRWILQFCLGAQIVLAVLVGVLVQQQGIQIWHLLAVAMVLGVAGAFEMPAVSALVPELVARPDIARAIAIDRSVFHATRLVGPALAGIAVAQLGAASAFYVNALSFFALMTALVTIPARRPGTVEAEEQRRSGMKEGIAYVLGDPPTLAMISLIALTTCLVFPMMMVLMPIYAAHELGVGPAEMGILMGLSGVGALTGSIGMLTVSRSGRPRRMAFAAAAIAAALLGASSAETLGAAAYSIVVLTIGTSTLIGLANTTVQERAPDALRGRVSAVAGLAFFGVMPFAAILMSSLSDLAGMRTILAINSGLYAVGGLAILATQGRRACEGPSEPISAPSA